MNLEELVETIERMVEQHDYPGFEARALNLGLPENAVKSSAKVFGEALQYDNIFVQLAALRWFQARPGLARSHLNSMLDLLAHADEWVRSEAIKTLERGGAGDGAVVLKISSLLKDSHEMVRQEAAKACGKLLSKSSEKNADVIASLRIAATDPNEKVRWKAQKALRIAGAYSASA